MESSHLRARVCACVYNSSSDNRAYRTGARSLASAYVCVCVCVCVCAYTSSTYTRRDPGTSSVSLSPCTCSYCLPWRPPWSQGAGWTPSPPTRRPWTPSSKDGRGISTAATSDRDAGGRLGGPQCLMREAISQILKWKISHWSLIDWTS